MKVGERVEVAGPCAHDGATGAVLSTTYGSGRVAVKLDRHHIRTGGAIIVAYPKEYFISERSKK